MVNNKRGFALVVCLSLMAFILLLLVSLSSYVQIEAAQANQSKGQLIARQNALLALHEAIGQLQMAAGPDQRVTATGSLWQNPQPGTEYYTGVWSSEDLDNNNEPDGTFLKWLVSRKNPSETEMIEFVDQPAPIAYDPKTNRYAATDEDYVVLVGEGSVAQDPDIPTEMKGIVAQKKILANNSGSYAWWIGDEGVKARVNIVDPAKISDLTDEEINRYKRAASMAMPRFATENITGLDFLQPNDPSLLKINSINGILNLDENKSAVVRSRFHDITLWSKGVQSNVRNGGLKKDLSLLFELSEENWKNSDFYKNSNTRYFNAPVAGDLSLLFNPKDGDLVNGNKITIPYGDKQLYGPAWDLLRDYYRLYKSVSNSKNSPIIEARAAYPSTSDMPYDIAQKRWSNSIARHAWRHWLGSNDPYMSKNASGAQHWNTIPSFPFVRLTKGVIAPYLSRMTLQVSVEINGTGPDNYQAQWILFPVIYLHNPYSIKIKVPASRFLWSLRDHKIFYNISNTVKVSDIQEISLKSFLQAPGRLWSDGKQGDAEFLLPEATFNPGEVLAFIPDATSWGNSVPMKAANQIDYSTGGDGLYMPPQQLKFINKDGSIGNIDEQHSEFRSLYASNNWTKFAWEIPSKIPGKYNTMSSIMLMGSNQLNNFNWSGSSGQITGGVLSQTRAFTIQELRLRTPVTTFDCYVKPVDLVYGNLTSIVAQKALSFPSFICSNPLAMSDQGMATAAQGSTVLSPARVGYVSDGAIDSSVLTEGFSGSGKGYWGPDLVTLSNATVLDVPSSPLHSIGHLQHVNLTEMPYYPVLAIGNSFPSPFLRNNNSLINSYNKSQGFATGDKIFYDLSYMANYSIWDNFFFSSIAPKEDSKSYSSETEDTSYDIADMIDSFLGKDRLLYNPHVTLYKPNNEKPEDTKSCLTDYNISAARLLTKGSFNINSTSKDSWKALLSGLNNAIIYINKNKVSEFLIEAPAAFTRFSYPNNENESNADYNSQNSWNGFPSLSQDEIENLSKYIVEGVKNRSIHNRSKPNPFNSLSSFVNRMLVSLDKFNSGGLIQKAIEDSGINNRFNSAHTFKTSDWNTNKTQLSSLPTTNLVNFANSDFQLNTASAAATYLLQSDILQGIAPYISARSDTFRIRTYGNFNEKPYGSKESEIWLEAIVQRVPTPVNPLINNQHEPKNVSQVGRNFIIISHRWLSNDQV